VGDCEEEYLMLQREVKEIDEKCK
jgi:hypothetical protein